MLSMAEENFHATKRKRGYIIVPRGITFLRLVVEKTEGKCHSSWEQKNELLFSKFTYKRLLSPIHFFSLVLRITCLTKAMPDWKEFSTHCCKAL